MGHDVWNVHVRAGEKHIGKHVAARFQGGGLELEYIRQGPVYCTLYHYYIHNKMSFSATLSNKELIAAAVLHLGKEEHSADIFWASPLETQKQGLQFTMEVLTGTGHEEVLASLKEWHLDTTLSMSLLPGGHSNLTLRTEPISPKALTD
jgi:hypothetical protein